MFSKKGIKGFLIKQSGLQEICQHHFYKESLDKNSVVVDLGGNKGFFSEPINKLFQCKVYVLEPEPVLFAQLPKAKNIRNFNYAVAGENGPVTLYVSTRRPRGHTIQSYLRKLWRHETSVEVYGITLESFMKEAGITVIDLLKVDIEGAEVALFRSVSDNTLKEIKQITIEMHAFAKPQDEAYVKSFQDIAHRLERAGFISLSFAPQGMDMLFLNKKSKQIKFRNKAFLFMLRAL